MAGPGITEQLRHRLETSIRRPGDREYGVTGAGVSTADGEVLFSVDGDGHLHLLLPVPAGVKIAEDRRSEGVQVVRHELIDGTQRRHYADLVCTKPHLRSTFHMLADEVIGRIAEGTVRADVAATAVIGRWRELLDRAPQPPLGIERLVGLYGELLVLRDLAALSPHALALWTGPRPQRHDFTSDRCDIEVKASLGASRAVQISSWSQLVPHEGTALYLRHYTLEESHGAPSVPDLVEQLCDRGMDRAELHAVLARLSYDPQHAAEYAKRCFRTLSEDVYRIDAGFPRIVPESFTQGHIPDGIIAIRYTVNLDAASACLLPASDWPGILATALSPTA